MVLVPADMPFTTPLLSPTVALMNEELCHVPPVTASASVVVADWQTFKAPVIAGGVGSTVSVVVAVLVNPLPSMTVTVYVIVPATVGDAITVAPVVAESPVEGAHE